MNLENNYFCSLEAEKAEKYSSQPSAHEFLNEGLTRSYPQNTKNSFENRLYNQQHLYELKDSKNKVSLKIIFCFCKNYKF